MDRRLFWVSCVAAGVLAALAAPAAAVDCSGVATFQSCTAYASGARVTFNGNLYHSIAPIGSTRDCPPNSPYDPSNDNWWTNDGACSGGSSTATATATATRTSSATATKTATATSTSASATATKTVTGTATATATATKTPTATSGSGSGNCSGVTAFQSCTAYASGAKVVFNNTLYHSLASIPSNRDCPPNSPYDPSNDNWWQNDGACSGGSSTATATATKTPTATSNGTATKTATATATVTPVSGGSVNLHRALYVMPYNSPIDIATYMNETGLKSFMISFILSGGGCGATWDGSHAIGDSVASNMIGTIRNKGGDVAISQGGYNGTKLGEACGGGTGSGSAYAAMKAVVDQYNVKGVDFDIEEPEIEKIGDDACTTTGGAVCNELDAVKQFAADGRTVSITLPSSTSGLNYFGGLVAKASYNKGICSQSNVHFRIMPFDNGFSNQPGDSETAISNFASQMDTYCHWSSGTSWSRIGASSMMGRSDSAEYMSVSAWQSLISWVNGKNMPDLTTWAEQRDRSCMAAYGQIDPGTKGDCSSVQQNEGDFGKAMAQ